MHELLQRMADVLSTPDPNHSGIQEIIMRYDARKPVAVGAVRETPPPFGSDGAQRLDRLEPAIAQLQRSIDELRNVVEQIRLSMATKVEVESVRDDIRRVADGYAHVSAQLRQNAELLKRFLNEAPR